MYVSAEFRSSTTHKNTTRKESDMRCRHKKSWLIAGGLIEWCNDCGAFRNLAPVSLKVNAVKVISSWCCPKMSYDDFEKKDLAWKRRYLVSNN